MDEILKLIDKEFYREDNVKDLAKKKIELEKEVNKIFIQNIERIIGDDLK